MRLRIAHGVAVPLTACLMGVLATSAAATPAPPFTQCPAVGADTSGCGILLNFDASGTASVLTDTSEGPYDGVEDTLIGVQNGSPVTIHSLTLTGTTLPFEFDGDGLCSVLGS